MKSTSKIHNILELINYLGQTYSVLQSHLSEIDRVILFWCFCNLCSCWTRPFHICSVAMFWFVDLKWKQCFEHWLASSSYINKQIWCKWRWKCFSIFRIPPSGFDKRGVGGIDWIGSMESFFHSIQLKSKSMFSLQEYRIRRLLKRVIIDLYFRLISYIRGISVYIHLSL